MPADVLSEVLSAVRLNGSVFFDVSATSPWVAEAPPSAQIADAVKPGAQHAIEYHAVIRGSCWISMVNGAPFEPVQLQEGDIAVIPHGEAHVVSSAPNMRAEPELAIFRLPEQQRDRPFKLRTGSGGVDDAHLMCGFFICDVRPFNPLLDALPRFMRIGRGISDATDALSQHFVRLASLEATDKRAGAQSVINKLSELMFIDVLRRYIETLPPERAGWLAGLRDPHVGKALSLLHEKPAQDWTLEELARAAGASRSVLAERFTALVGVPPIAYLAKWRMQLAAEMLTRGAANIATIAAEIGYDSEASFSRAFKKMLGVPPSQWRRRSD